MSLKKYPQIFKHSLHPARFQILQGSNAVLKYDTGNRYYENNVVLEITSIHLKLLEILNIKKITKSKKYIY